MTTEQPQTQKSLCFSADLGPAIHHLLQIPHQAQCLTQTERTLLSSTQTPTQSTSASTILELLSQLFIRPCLTLPILRLFRPVIVELAGRCVQNLNGGGEVVVACPVHGSDASPRQSALMDVDSASTRSPKHDLEGNIVNAQSPDSKSKYMTDRREITLNAFALILPVAPQLLSHAVSAFIFGIKPLEVIGSIVGQDENAATHKRIRTLLRSIYRLLRTAPATFSTLRNWSPLYGFLTYPDWEARTYAALTISHVLRMADDERRTFLEKYAGEGDRHPVTIRREEDEFDAREQAQLFVKHITAMDGGVPPFVVTAADLCPVTVDLCGVLLPISHGSLSLSSSTTSVSDVGKKNLVLTWTTTRNLHSIGLALSLGLPILLEGPPGVGKTSLVEEAARLTGCEDLLKIHLGDQTDSKVLLGTYVCTNVPGTFRWQPGVLATAVSEGRWILIEDIDLAPLEVVSVLLPLLETRHLFIPSRGEKIKAKEGFRIFATRTLFPTKGGFAPRTLQMAGQNLWTKVEARALPADEVFDVLSKQYTSLRTLLPEITSAFSMIAQYFESNPGLGRHLSLRDLIKWCSRVDAICSTLSTAPTAGEDLQLTVREDLFREAVECFVGMIPKKEIRDSISQTLGTTLQVPTHRVQFYIDSYTPTITTTDKHLTIGRATLPVLPSHTTTRTTRPFAATSTSTRLLERLAFCTTLREPVLLVGETGTGKTSVVQHLADLTNHTLIAVNMSQQSDSSDLLGGFKPVDARVLVVPIKEAFDDLFERTFNVQKNRVFVDMVRKAFVRKNWGKLVVGFKSAIQMAGEVFRKRETKAAEHGEGTVAGVKRKRTKVLDGGLESEWRRFGESVEQFEAQYEQIKSNFLFSFVEGALVKAIRMGHWVLLDEINLATAETLECLSGLLQGSEGSLLLMERGDTAPVERHREFRLFACMNPANDAGKRDLPPGLRSRFTEFWVDSPDAHRSDLLLIIRQYLRDFLPPASEGELLLNDVADFFLSVRDAAIQGRLYDGADQRVHVSMRTLTRALSYACQVAGVYGLRRGLYEGVCMTFGTGLGRESVNVMDGFLGPLKKGFVVGKVPRCPGVRRNGDGDDEMSGNETHTLISSFWIERGPLPTPPDLEKHYVLTESVTSNLANLARAVMSRKYPVLIQGPTSAGKTSMVEYLAGRTGHRFVRINNHEHTDLQEYLGSYVGDEGGRLVFQEGILVEALRKGYWIVLDELNLAPSDVLEALNRLLDDNRELLIPETQEVVHPHPHFMLFATQNPAGQYGGRKQLSRAFRNRFLELHFEDIPETELEEILSQRCDVAPSHARRIVEVWRELQSARGKGRVFEGRFGFATLRDLFRWALRQQVPRGGYRLLVERESGYQKLAEDGFMLLAERMRKEEDRVVVRRAIEKVMRVKIDEDALFEGIFAGVLAKVQNDERVRKAFDEVVWTKAMKKSFVLVLMCVEHREPVLLVGDTGCGKTSVVQVLSGVLGRELKVVNAHQHSETADFLGSQRPVRGRVGVWGEGVGLWRGVFAGDGEVVEMGDGDVDGMAGRVEEELVRRVGGVEEGSVEYEEITRRIERIRYLRTRTRALFEWHDGPLVQAMRQGDHFLLDEISLADDSVLERLNSVLEPSQLLVLAEKGGKEVEELHGSEGFRFLATMNPGGDYGKKELSPALRNRFTEIWVPPVAGREDCWMIISKKFEAAVDDVRGLRDHPWADRMLDFVEWFAGQLRRSRESVISLRDILAWVGFLCGVGKKVGAAEAFVHGGCMVFVDGIGVNPLFGMVGKPEGLRRECRRRLREMAGLAGGEAEAPVSGGRFGVRPFFVENGPVPVKEVQFAMKAPTTMRNCMRVLRGLQLRKPILLEGSPGVGKTSLISSLSAVTGHDLVRINLSEQTDLMDLFGSDLPVEGGSGGEFAWRDGPFLKAMQEGSWVLLDELNLASQQVLEGLNACLDHRAEVYVPELDRAFGCHPGFRVFAAQNPQHQGGGRKGLPRSFVNRFTQVYIEALTEGDLGFISRTLHPDVDEGVLEKMIRFNERMKEETMERCSFGMRGGPWEFNLRDVMRWVELVKSVGRVGDPGDYLEMVYSQRMRTAEDRGRVRELYREVFGSVPEGSLRRPFWQVLEGWVQVGNSFLKRRGRRGGAGGRGVPVEHLQVLTSELSVLESLVKCVERRWMALLTGPGASGKTSLVRVLASLAGERLEEFSMNPGVDAVELLGGFEQADLKRRERGVLGGVERIFEVVVREVVRREGEGGLGVVEDASRAWERIHGREGSGGQKGKHLLDVAAVEGLLQGLETLVNQYAISLTEEGVPSVQHVLSLLHTYRASLTEGVHGRFEWIDGTLIRALEEGHWILIDNVNLCPASVLDRLNSLFEPGGVLMVNERGLVNGEVKVIRPHVNFRIFMTMDPRFGEVSRAMRNRAVELFVGVRDDGGVRAPSDVDFVRVLNDVGVPGMKVPRAVAALLDEVQRQDVECEGVDVRAVVTYGKLVVERVQRGDGWEEAVRKALEEAYPTLDVGEVRIAALTGELVSVGRDLFDSVDVEGRLAAPTSWPLPVAGRLLTEHSQLAGVAVAEGPLESLVKWDEEGLKESALFKAVEPVPGRVELFAAARRLLWEFVDGRRLQIRLSKFTHGGGDALTVAMVPVLANQDPVYGNVLRMLQEEVLRSAAVPAQLLLEQPADLHNNPTLASYVARNLSTELQQLWTWHAQLVYLRHIERRLYEAKLVEEQVYVAGKSLRVNKMNVAQQSHAYVLGRVGESQLVHAGVRTFWPLLTALKEAVGVWVKEWSGGFVENVKILTIILDQYDHLWKSLQSNDLQFDRIYVTIRRMRKALHQVEPYVRAQAEMGEDDASGRLVRSMVDTVEALDLSNLNTSSVLYKRGGVITLRKAELFEVETLFQKIGRRLDFRVVDVAGWINHPALCISDESKASIIEGIATLYYLNETKTDNAALVEVLRGVADRLADQLTQLEGEAEKLQATIAQLQPTGESLVAVETLVPLQEVAIRSERTARLTAWSVTDVANLKREMAVLAKLSAIVEMEGADDLKMVELKKLATELREFKDEAFEHTSRNPLDVESVQRLIWLTEADGASERSVSDGQAVATMRGVLQDGLYKWYRALWSNAANVWSVCMGSDDIVTILDGNLMQLLSGNVKDAKDLDVSTNGASLLHTAVNTRFAFRMLAPMDGVPIHGIQGKARQLEHLKDYFISSRAIRHYAYDHDFRMIITKLKQFMEGHTKSFSADTMAEIQSVFKDLLEAAGRESAQLVPTLQSLLQRAHSDISRAHFTAFIQPALACIGSILAGTNNPVAALGQAWLYVSLAFVRAYIPKVPVDAASGPAAKLSFTDDEAIKLRAEINVRAEAERLLTGNNDNRQVRDLMAQLEDKLQFSKKWQRRVALRPAKSQMREVHNDLLQLNNTILGEAVVSSLLSEIRNSNHQTIAAREPSLQSTLAAFVEHMEVKYPMYRDVLQPIHLAVYQFKYGLRLVAQSGAQTTPSQQAVEKLQTVLSEFVTSGVENSFPMDEVLHALRHAFATEKGQANKHRVRVILAMLHRVQAVVTVRTGVNAELLRIMHTLLGEVVEMWSAAEEERLEKLRAEEALYKYKEMKHEVESEAVLEEEEYKELFPDFGAELADIVAAPTDDGVEAAKDDEKGAKAKSSTWDSETGQEVRLLHEKIVACLAMTSSQTGEAAAQFVPRWTRAYDRSYDSAADVAKIQTEYASLELDGLSYQGHSYMSIRRWEELSRLAFDTETGISGGYDFYRDSNVPEARKIHSVLLSFDRRICDLLTQWPDHAVLRQLAALCTRVAGFAITSPIMKLLTGLEMLLMTSQDWEAYASREVSIKANMDEIIVLIVEWRKLELRCWRQLLDVEDRKSEGKASALWFHLWKIVVGVAVRGPNGEMENGDGAELMKSMLTAVDEFCNSSTLGEFATRITMLRTFYLHLKCASLEVPEVQRHHFESVGNIVWNVCQYYEQFEPEVKNLISGLRKPIVKELNEYVKIASWKDVNVYALKESATRTHHHLHKFIKKYRIVLDKPVKEAISAAQERVVLEGDRSSRSVETLLAKVGTGREDISNAEMVPHPVTIGGDDMRFNQIDHLVSRMKTLSTKITSDSFLATAGTAVDELGGTILERIKEFRDVNGSLEGGSKTAKNQKLMRKKALVDLLRHLAHLGLSPRCTHVYTQQREPSYIYALPVPDVATTVKAADETTRPFSQHIAELFDAGNSYFYRNLARLTKLRALALGHSQDLTSGEVDRASSFVEHLLHLAIEERLLLEKFATSFKSLLGISKQMSQLHATVTTAPSTLIPSGQFLEGLNEVRSAVDEAVVMCSQTSILVKMDATVSGEAKGHLQGIISQLNGAKVLVDRLHAESMYVGAATILSVSSVGLLKGAIAAYVGCSETWNSLRTVPSAPYVAMALSAVRSTMNKRLVALRKLTSSLDMLATPSSGIAPTDLEAAVGSANAVIDSLLIAFQALNVNKNRETEPDEEMDEFGMHPKHIVLAHQELGETFRGLQVGRIMNSLETFLAEVQGTGSVDGRTWASQACSRIYPLLHQFILTTQRRLFDFMLLHRSLGKLTYILCNTFAALFKDGYCVPQEEKGEEQEGGEETATGTGIGEGAGDKDVSDEIDNTDQVEGMQNEASNEPNSEQHIPEEDDAIEMDTDFEGKMEDAQRTGEEEGEAEEEQEEGEEPEEQMGELDGKGDVVDEKLWGDEDESAGQDEKTERDAPVDSQGGESETVAKEDAGGDDEQSNKEEKKEEAKQPNPANGEDEEGEEEGEGDAINEDHEENYEDSHGFDVKQADNAEQPQEDEEQEQDGDLPEDMNLDGEEEDQEQGGDADNDVPDRMDVDRPQDSIPETGDKEDAMEEEGAREEEETGSEMGDEEKPEAAELAEQESGMDKEDETMEPAEEPDNNIQDSAHGYGEQDEQPQKDEKEDEEDKGSADKTQAVDESIKSSTQPFGIQGQQGQQSDMNSGEEAMDEAAEMGADTEMSQDMGGTSEGAQHSTSKQKPEGRDQKKTEQTPNPRRSVGDALKNWMKRLQAISDAVEDNEAADKDNGEQDVGEDGAQAMEYEFVQEDDQAADAQALDVATADQMKEMDRKALADDEKQEEYADLREDMMDIEEEQEEPADSSDKYKQPEQQGERRSQPRPAGGLDLEKDEGGQEEKAGEDKAALGEEDEGEEGVGGSNGILADDEMGSDVEEGVIDGEAELLDAAGYDKLREELEQSVIAWRESGQDAQEAQELWRRYTTLTRDLSFELCEQLRLILEPTLATKLKGDYRTGKRLNMRKVIPYIASQFKKDKIWLRRTKPSKRTYQIMIAIDDSKSMAESRSVQLAYESLALITKALTQLEVGEVSVVSFGQDISLLHPFERAFSDEAGTEVIRRFTFDQNRTQVLRMMESTMGILEQARASGSVSGATGDLWQLQLIISDGICEDHARIQALVRKAAEMRIMIVFLVLDPKDAISGMKNVTFGGGGMKVNRYMDTFPFDYYVLVKDVGLLPEVLSDTLRQYFMFVSG
ncbi:AAA ATPase midasin [Rhizophlyctis rosea]|nr:AAA ATPase midasin [Rhizophlyctis rosea]